MSKTSLVCINRKHGLRAMSRVVTRKSVGVVSCPGKGPRKHTLGVPPAPYDDRDADSGQTPHLDQWTRVDPCRSLVCLCRLRQTKIVSDSKPVNPRHIDPKTLFGHRKEPVAVPLYMVPVQGSGQVRSEGVRENETVGSQTQ